MTIFVAVGKKVYTQNHEIFVIWLSMCADVEYVITSSKGFCLQTEY